MSTRPWVVQHRDGWCALRPGAELDPEAWNDPTLCGHVVTMRGGSKRGMPTCAECRALLACDAVTDTANRRAIHCGRLASWQWTDGVGEDRLACGIHARSVQAWNPPDRVNLRPYIPVARENA